MPHHAPVAPCITWLIIHTPPCRHPSQSSHLPTVTRLVILIPLCRHCRWGLLQQLHKKQKPEKKSAKSEFQIKEKTKRDRGQQSRELAPTLVAYLWLYRGTKKESFPKPSHLRPRHTHMHTSKAFYGMQVSG